MYDEKWSFEEGLKRRSRYVPVDAEMPRKHAVKAS